MGVVAVVRSDAMAAMGLAELERGRDLARPGRLRWRRGRRQVSWIQNVAEAKARGRLKQLYAKARGAGPVDSILTVHGLRPHTLDGHLALYRSVLGLGVRLETTAQRESGG